MLRQYGLPGKEQQNLDDKLVLADLDSTLSPDSIRGNMMGTDLSALPSKVWIEGQMLS